MGKNLLVLAMLFCVAAGMVLGSSCLAPEDTLEDLEAAQCYSRCEELLDGMLQDTEGRRPAGWGMMRIQPCTCGVVLEDL